MTSEHKATVPIIVILATAALCTVGVAALKRAEAGRGRGERASVADLGADVDVAVAAMRTVTPVASSTGFLQPFEALTVSAQVPGHVQEQHVEIADHVASGDPLFQIDDSLHVIAVTKARAAADRAKSELFLADEDVKRIERLKAQGSANPREVLQVETAHAIATAMLKKAQADLDEAETLRDKTVVRAPITGEIARVYTRQGEHAQVGQPLVDLIETDRLKLVVQLSARRVGAFRPGDPAVIRSAAIPGRVFHGAVLRIAPRAMPDSRKFEVEIEIPNADRTLRPGFFVEAKLTPQDRDGDAARTGILTIPRIAVFEVYRQQYCYVVRRTEGSDELRAFQTSVEAVPLMVDPRVVQIFSGVEPGDRVIVGGLQHVTHQAVVRVKAP